MRTKHALAVIAAACLSAGPASADQAGNERRLGKLMALPVMATFCNLTLTPEQITEFDKLAPKLQQEAGLSEDQMKDAYREITAGLKPDDCTTIASHWPETVPALIAQAKAEP